MVRQNRILSLTITLTLTANMWILLIKNDRSARMVGKVDGHHNRVFFTTSNVCGIFDIRSNLASAQTSGQEGTLLLLQMNKIDLK